jgi:hypothetical protein
MLTHTIVRRTRLALLGPLLAVGLASGLIALFGAGGASAVTLRAGELVIDADGAVWPERLPGDAPAPISFRVGASISTVDQSPLPALQTFAFDADRQGEFFTAGLPKCAPAKLQSTTTAQAMRACGDSLVGTGTTSALLAFPERSPYLVSAPLLMFNGGSKGGKTLLVMQVYARKPIPTTFVVLGKVTPGKGAYGTHTTVAIPTIANGYGSLKSFAVRIHRTWTYRGKKRSFLLARCATGHYLAHAEFGFADGTLLSGTLIKSCKRAAGG